MGGVRTSLKLFIQILSFGTTTNKLILSVLMFVNLSVDLLASEQFLYRRPLICSANRDESFRDGLLPVFLLNMQEVPGISILKR